MANRFYAEPATPMMGLQFLSEQIKGRRREAMIGGVLKAAYDIFTNGTPGELSDFMGSTPGGREAVENIISSQDKIATRNIVNASKKVLMEDLEPVAVLTDAAKTTMSEGGDASEIIKSAKDIVKEKNEAKRKEKIAKAKDKAEKTWLASDPGSYKKYKELKKTASEKKQKKIEEKKAKAVKIMAERQAKLDKRKAKAERNWMIADPESYKKYKELKTTKRDMPKHQKTGAFLVKDEYGETSVVVGDYDPATGELKTVKGAIDGEVVSKLGETPTEQTERIVGQKRKEKAVAGEESRASTLIKEGVSAAQSTATLRRGIELLGMVKTGGFAAAAQKAKNIFGIESANEGELSNSLSKAVLSQLRETFGAAFTAQEGRQLTNIEAKFGKSVEANKRLLAQALKIAERKAKRARAAALKRGDQATVNDIDDLLTFSLSMEAPEKKPKPKAGPTLQEFMQKAKAVNPGVSEQDLSEYYKKKYGGM